MGQPDTAVGRDTATGTLPTMFAPTGRVPETMPSGLTVTCTTETLKWPELTHNDRTFVFNRELTVRVTQEEGGCSFAADEFGLLGFGHTRREAQQSFCLDFAIQWDDLVCEEDENKLSLDAVDLKHALLGLVKAQRQR